MIGDPSELSSMCKNIRYLVLIFPCSCFVPCPAILRGYSWCCWSCILLVMVKNHEFEGSNPDITQAKPELKSILFLFYFGAPHTWQCLRLTCFWLYNQESLLVGLSRVGRGNYQGCPGTNLIWPVLGQVYYPLNYYSGPGSILF